MLKTVRSKEITLTAIVTGSKSNWLGQGWEWWPACRFQHFEYMEGHTNMQLAPETSTLGWQLLLQSLKSTNFQVLIKFWPKWFMQEEKQANVTSVTFKGNAIDALCHLLQVSFQPGFHKWTPHSVFSSEDHPDVISIPYAFELIWNILHIKDIHRAQMLFLFARMTAALELITESMKPWG
jgi:hypothetical protein